MFPPFSKCPEARRPGRQARLLAREMSCPRLPVSAVALLGLLLAFASVVLHRGNRCLEISLSRLWGDSISRGPAKASDDAAVGENTRRRVEQLGRNQRRDLFGWGGGGGGGGGDGGGGARRRVRLAFLIMSSGDDVAKLELLLPEIYHPDNVYLVHVDAKAPQDQVQQSTYYHYISNGRGCQEK